MKVRHQSLTVSLLSFSEINCICSKPPTSGLRRISILVIRAQPLFYLVPGKPPERMQYQKTGWEAASFTHNYWSPCMFLVHDVCHTGEYLLMLSDLFTNILDGLSEICLPNCWLHFSDEPLMLFEPLAFVIPPSIPRLEKQAPYACPCHWSHHCTARTKARSDTSGTNHIVPLNEHSWVAVGKGDVNTAVPLFLVTHSYISRACAL